jgi:dihydroorotase
VSREGLLHPALEHAESAPGPVLVREARLFDPRTGLDRAGDLLVRGGRVAEIGEPGGLEAPEGAETVEAEGLTAFPGFVDPHVHLRTPGREDEEDLDSGTRAAAAGGYCAVLAMPNTDPVVDSAPVLGALRERARVEARIPTGFTAAITRGQRGEELTEMAELADAGAFAFTDDGMPVRSAGVMRQALQYQKLAGRTLALHEEEASLSGAGAMHEGAASAALGLAGIPSVSESTMVARDLLLARHEEGRIHVQHVSARESVEAIERALADGVQVSAEASPHHLLLTDDAVRSLDTHFKMNPPLRGEDDRRALVDGLRSGALSCVATDHAPHSREEKEQPFELAPMGVIGLETAFAALYTDLVEAGVLSLGLLVERMSAGGEPFGLAVPRLEPGAPANLCLVDLGAEWEAGEPKGRAAGRAGCLPEAGYESRSANSPFAGRRLRGRVRLTVAGGQVAYRERSFAIGAVR